MGGKKPLRRPLWPPTRATASNYYPLGLDGAGGAAKPLLRAPKKPAPLHGRLPAFSGAVDAFERARKCFLEWRYFFSIILSEFLKNRVALQLECVPQMMFINKTLLQKEHIRIPDNDWTWDEFYSLCEQLTRDTDGDGIVDQFGVYDYGWEEALVANGCSLFSEDGQHCLLNQSAQESAMQFARKIYQLNAGTDLSEKTFDEGRVAFRPMLFSEYRSYEPYPWRIKRSSNFEWDCIAMPSGTSVGGGNYSRLSTLMLGISQRTKHSRLSWELLKTIACTEEMQTMVYTELSGVSALHSVTESDEVARLLQLDSQDTASRGMSTLPAIMEDTLATPRFARYHQAMERADRLITEAMSADKNFELQLLQIQQQLDVTLTS